MSNTKPRQTPYPAFFKPLLDRSAAVVLILLLSPLIAAIALLVRLDSPGPAFFKQRRVGLGKQEFLLWKFRTMAVTAPSDMPSHLLKDPASHITRLGRFLRRSSVDEIPQLFNIAAGEMSFVGPRPALWNQYDLVAERDCYGANDVLPGLTGWAQVTGRDELPIPEKAARDGWYANRVSFKLDVKILLVTLRTVITAKGIVEGSTGGGAA